MGRESRRMQIQHLTLAVFMLGCFFISSCAKPEGPSLGSPAPDFTARDLSGNEISLAKYRGKVVLLDFWATWCPPCVEELPHVKRVSDKYKSDGFSVIGINLNQNQSDVEHFVRMVGIDWPQIFDGRGAIATIYNVVPIPATFLIDREGIIRYTNLRGQVELERAVRDVLKLPPIASSAGAGDFRQSLARFRSYPLFARLQQYNKFKPVPHPISTTVWPACNPVLEPPLSSDRHFL